VKVAVAVTGGGGPGGSTVTVKVAGPTGAPGRIRIGGRGIGGIVPAAVVVKVLAVITPAGTAVIVPGAPNGNPNPVTFTAVPGKPMAGVRMMAGAMPTV
jgi:hypothetical protein